MANPSCRKVLYLKYLMKFTYLPVFTILTGLIGVLLTVWKSIWLLQSCFTLLLVSLEEGPLFWCCQLPKLPSHLTSRETTSNRVLFAFPPIWNSLVCPNSSEREKERELLRGTMGAFIKLDDSPMFLKQVNPTRI